MICLLRRHYPLLLLAINTHTSFQLGGFTYSDHHSQVERTRRQRLRRSGASVTGESPAGVTIVTMIGTMCRSVTGGWIKWVRWGCQVPDNSVSPPATLHQHISWPNTTLLFTNNLEKYFWQKYLYGQSSIIFANLDLFSELSGAQGDEYLFRQCPFFLSWLPHDSVIVTT